jgi:hypothetical protein
MSLPVLSLMVQRGLLHDVAINYIFGLEQLYYGGVG